MVDATAHLHALTDLALPTRLPSCSEFSILRLWQALPNLRVLALSADLPPSLLAKLPGACPYLVDLKLNLLARARGDLSASRHHLNHQYADLCKAYAPTLQSVLLGWFDLDVLFVSQLVQDCPKLKSVELRDCREASAEVFKLLGPRLVALRDTPINAAAMKIIANAAVNCHSFELIVNDLLAADVTDTAIAWARDMGSHKALRHLVIKGCRDDGVVVNWNPVLTTLCDTLEASGAQRLETLRIERIKSITNDIWQSLLRVIGPSLTTVSAFESAPITALQFISSVSLFCPKVERVRLPRLYDGEEEELYDAISELMELESRVPFVCVAALRNYTDFLFTFLRRGGLEWTVDDSHW